MKMNAKRVAAKVAAKGKAKPAARAAAPAKPKGAGIIETAKNGITESVVEQIDSLTRSREEFVGFKPAATARIEQLESGLKHLNNRLDSCVKRLETDVLRLGREIGDKTRETAELFGRVIALEGGDAGMAGPRFAGVLVGAAPATLSVASTAEPAKRGPGRPRKDQTASQPPPSVPVPADTVSRLRAAGVLAGADGEPVTQAQIVDALAVLVDLV
jgi:hypothetical protein